MAGTTILTDAAGNIQSILNLISLKDIVNIVLFLFLVFLGVAARIMIEIERYHTKYKDIHFFTRYFIAIVLAYVLKVWLQDTNLIKNYYSEVIILFCIFVNDIINFVFDNKSNIFLYILNAVTKGITDMKKYLVKNPKKSNNDNTDNPKFN